MISNADQRSSAWQKDDGSLYVKLHGTQVVGGFSLYPVTGKTAEPSPGYLALGFANSGPDV